MEQRQEGWMETTETKKPSGLLARVITALVGLPLLGWVILAGQEWMWFIIVLAAIALGLIEFYGMATKEGEGGVAWMGVAMGSLLACTMYWAPDPMLILCAVFTVVVVMMMTTLFSYQKMERAIGLMGVGISGVFYVTLLTTCMALLRRDPGEAGRYWVLLLLATIWAGDTGAYFVGRFLGKHKLSPVVSPKKTWEGAIGGLACSIGMAYLVVWLTPLDMHWILVLALAAPAAILGQIGDLCESLIKRSCGAKDSGKIIYGHGGILDRIDALMFAAPYFLFFYSFADRMIFMQH
jgi:phosphatidate cytidylyltransferase